MLLPDFGGSECDSADILAGYASSPVTFRRKQPPKSPREGGDSLVCRHDFISEYCASAVLCGRQLIGS